MLAVEQRGTHQRAQALALDAVASGELGGGVPAQDRLATVEDQIGDRPADDRIGQVARAVPDGPGLQIVIRTLLQEHRPAHPPGERS